MQKHAGSLFKLAAVFLVATAVGAAAQGAASRCPEYAAEATDASRDAALRSAYEAVLQAHDPRMLKAWNDRRGRIGEAPGQQVTRLVTRCAPVRGGQKCHVEATICRG